jgi:hypothetical protein
MGDSSEIAFAYRTTPVNFIVGDAPMANEVSFTINSVKEVPIF